MKSILKLSLFLPLLLTGCGTKDESSNSSIEESSDELSNESVINPSTNTKAMNIYQLLVYSFADSNGDGIGDFKGIVDKLDYLSNLGVEGIWLSPIHKCNSYHGYDVTDYYAINEKFETKSGNTKYDYKYLLDKCHEKGIKVIMDLVLNHTASNHVWKSSHSDWYSGKDVFGGGMSDLNYDKQEVQDAMIDVGTYWLDKGFDGYRLDAAMWLYNSKPGTDASSVDHNKNYAYWKKWCKAMTDKNPDCYIVGEVLNKNHDLSYQYAQAGFDSTFDFNVRTHIENAIKNPSYDYVGNTIKDMNKALKYNQDYILGRAISNHDIGRFTQKHNGMSDESAHYVTSFEDIRLANALNIMMRGNTFVYYGDELGLSGTADGARKDYYDDLNFRTPMPWGTGRTDSKKYFWSQVPGDKSTTSVAKSGKTAEEDASSSTSLYYAVKTLLNIKKNSNAIKNGAVKKMTNLPEGLQGYTLSDDKETTGFIYNPSNKTITYETTDNVIVNVGGSESNSLNLPSKSYIVTQVNK